MRNAAVNLMVKQLLSVLALAVVLAPIAARAQDEVVYYHTDAIGSVRMVTDATGNVIARYDYLPFGETWPTSPPNTSPDVRQFAGKERDPETKLDYFGARYFRAESGRFTSPDPVMNIQSASTDPQRWNRYAYAVNNPFRFVDPDGRDILPTAWNTGKGADGWLLGATSAAKVIWNALLELNSPGHPGDSKSQARREAQFLQPESADEAALMGLAEVAILAAPLMRSSRSFFAGTSYTPKVLKQMTQGDMHAFPESVKAFEAVGKTFWKPGGDGMLRQWLEIPGSYKGQDGVFQFIKESNGEINHRLFVPYF